jgi:copper(I)-binding protein
LTITSSIDDNLMSASVDPAVAAKTELHETVPAAAGATESSMMNGSTAPTESTSMTAATAMPGATSPAGEVAMTMRPVASIAVKAGTAFALAPGGYHIMMVDLVAPLQTGKTIELTLTFEKGGVKKITVPIREDAP